MDCALQRLYVMRRLDAPFRALALVTLVAVGALGCFGVGLAASRPTADLGILDTNDVPPPADL